MNLLKYIGSLRNLLMPGQSNIFVLGNTSADYDSIFGSIIYAYFMTSSMNVVHLPLIDCAQADIHLRFQVDLTLEKLGIKKQSLLFTEMIPNLYTSNHTFLLYDHNARPEAQSSVTQIIDHHAYEPEKIACNHMIHHSGSALTFLFYLYYPQYIAMFEGTQFYAKFTHFLSNSKYQQTVAPEALIDELICNGILLDTYNFDSHQKERWTEQDLFAVSFLKKKIKPIVTYEELSLVKSDESRNLKLTFKEQQRKDFKKIDYGDFYINYSTILLDIELFLAKYEADLEAQEMEDSGISMFMFAFSKKGEEGKKLEKYLLFNSKSSKLLDFIEKILPEIGQFQRLESFEGWRRWTDPSGKITRKTFDKQLRSRL